MNDEPNKFKLYGRDKEITILENLFHEVCKGQFEILLVKGMPGIGKTALIKTVFKTLTQNKGYFLCGKFEQYTANEPYRPFVQVLNNMINYILTEAEETIIKLGRKLKSILGSDGGFIAARVPEIELIIGPQEIVDHSDIKKLTKRFEKVFIRFLQAFASREHPLILFLDDLQWADEESIELINGIANNTKNQYLLFICSHREENLVKQLFVNNTQAKEMDLANLNISNTYDIIKDHFNLPSELLERISEHIYLKTLGNPFNIDQIITLIKKENKIYLDDIKNNNIEEVLSSIKGIKENISIIDMFFNRIKRIFKDDMQLLKLIACVGSSFDLNIISLITKERPLDTKIKLQCMIEENIFLPIDSGERIVKINQYEDEISGSSFERIQYKFIHDKIHQAVYDLLDENEKKEMHSNIGKILFTKMDETQVKNNIFKITSHMNYGLNSIKDDEGRVELAQLNYLAGLKAKNTAALKLAHKFFAVGVTILPENSDQVLRYNLYYELYQSMFIVGKYDEAKKVFAVLLELSTNDIERSKTYMIKALLLSFIRQYQEAVKAGIEALSYLDVLIKDRHYILQLVKELPKTLWLFRNQRLKKMQDLPETDSPKILLIFETITQLAPTANLYNQDLFAVAVLKMTNITAYKRSKYSPIGFAGAAIFYSSIVCNYKKVKKLEEFAITACNQYEDKKISCVTYFILSTIVMHWIHHYEFSLQYAYKSFKDGLEAGELYFTGYAMTTILEMKYVMGKSLEVILRNCTEFHQYAINMDFQLVTDLIDTFRRFSNTLQGDYISPSKLFPEDLEEKLRAKESNEILTYYILEAQLYLLKGNYKEALIIEEKAYKILNSITGYILFAEHIFYYSLAVTRSYEKLSNVEKKRYKKILKRNIKKLKTWADVCSENHLHKYQLIKAEIARINKEEKAFSLYDQAIESANENGYVQNAAIINECAAIYYKEIGRDSAAGLYINEAYKKYMTWGAHAKSKLIFSEWPEVITEKSDEVVDDNSSIVDEGKQDYSIKKDPIIFDTIMDMYYMITDMEDSKNILNKLLDGIAKVTNADKVCILMKKNNGLFVEASSEPEMNSCRIEEDTSEVNLPKRVLRYVKRTHKTVLYHKDIMAHDIFLKDSYIIKKRPHSIACIPFIHQKLFLGVIYLERNVQEIGFNHSHVEAVNLLIEKIMYAEKLELFTKDTNHSKDFQLTQRELEVLKLLGQGKSNKEIAEELSLTVSTIKSHLLNIYSKLDVNKRIQAVVKAREFNLID